MSRAEALTLSPSAARYGLLEARCSCGFLHPIAISKLGIAPYCPNKRAATSIPSLPSTMEAAPVPSRPPTTAEEELRQDTETYLEESPAPLPGSARSPRPPRNVAFVEVSRTLTSITQATQICPSREGSLAVIADAEIGVAARPGGLLAGPPAPANGRPSAALRVDGGGPGPLLQAAGERDAGRASQRLPAPGEARLLLLEQENRELKDLLAQANARYTRGEAWATPMGLSVVSSADSVAQLQAKDAEAKELQAINAALKSEAQSLQEEVTRLSRALAGSQDDRVALQADLNALERQLWELAPVPPPPPTAALEARLAALAAERDAAHDAAAALQAEREELASAVRVLEGQSATLTSANAKLVADMEAFAREVETLQATAQQNAVVAEIHRRELRISELEDELIHYKSMHARHQQRSMSLEEERDQLLTSGREVHGELLQAHAALCRQQELCAALEEELSTARQENEALLEELQAVTEALAGQQEELQQLQQREEQAGEEAAAHKELFETELATYQQEAKLALEQREQALEALAALQRAGDAAQAELQAAVRERDLLRAIAAEKDESYDKFRVAQEEVQTLRHAARRHSQQQFLTDQDLEQLRDELRGVREELQQQKAALRQRTQELAEAREAEGRTAQELRWARQEPKAREATEGPEESADVARGPQRGAEVRALADQLQAAEQLLAAVRLENEHLEALQVELREGLSQVRTEALHHRQRAVQLQHENQCLTTEVQSLVAEAEGLRGAVATQQQRYATLAQEKEQLAAATAEQEDRVAQLAASTAALQARWDAARGDSEATARDLRACREELRQAQDALRRRSSVEDVAAGHAALQERLGALQAELEAHRTTAAKQQQRQAAAAQERDGLAAALADALEEVAQQQAHVQQLERRAAGLREERDRLSESLREREDDTSTVVRQQATAHELKAVTADRDRLALELAAAQGEAAQQRAQAARGQQQAAAAEQGAARLRAELEALQRDAEQLRGARTQQYQRELSLVQEKEALQADLHTQAVEADSHRAALQQLQQRLLAVQQERDKAAATVVELQDELAQQRAAGGRLERRVAALTQERDRQLQALAAIEGDSSLLSQRQSAVHEELQALRLERDRLAEEVQRLEQEAAAQRTARLELQQRSTTTELQRDRLEAELRALQDDQQQATTTAAQSRLSLLASVREKEALARRVADLEEDVARLSDANRDLNTQVRQHHREYSILMDANNEMDRLVATLQKAQVSAAQEAEAFKAQCQTLTERCEALQVAAERQGTAAASERRWAAELGALREERDAAAAAAQGLQRELEALQRGRPALLQQLEDLKRQCAQQDAALQDSGRQLEDAARQRDRLAQQAQALAEEKATLEAEAASSGEQQDSALRRLRTALEDGQRQHAALREQCTHLETDRDATARKCRQAQQLLEEKEEEVSALKKKLGLAVEEQDSLRQALRQGREAAARLAAELEQRDARLASLQEGRHGGELDRRRIVQLEGLIEELRHQGLTYEEQLEQLTETHEEDLLHVRRLEEENAQLLEEQRGQDAQLADLRQQLQRVTQECREQKLKFQALTVEYQTLAEQNSTLVQREGQISTVKGELRDQFALLKAAHASAQAENDALAEQLREAQAALAQAARERELLLAQAGPDAGHAELERELLEARSGLARERATAKRLARELEDARLEAALVARSQQQVEALQEELKDRGHEIANLQQRLHEFARLKDETDNKDAVDHAQMRREFEKMAAHVVQVDSALAAKEALILQLQKEKARLIDDYKALQGHSTRTADQERDFAALKAKLDAHQAQLEGMRGIYDRRMMELTKKYTTELQDLKQQFLAAREESQRLALELEKSAISGYEAKVTRHGLDGLQAKAEHEAALRRQAEAECARLRTQVELFTKALEDTRSRRKGPPGHAGRHLRPDGSWEEEPGDCARCVQRGVIPPSPPRSVSPASSQPDHTDDEAAHRRPWR